MTAMAFDSGIAHAFHPEDDAAQEAASGPSRGIGPAPGRQARRAPRDDARGDGASQRDYPRIVVSNPEGSTSDGGAGRPRDRLGAVQLETLALRDETARVEDGLRSLLDPLLASHNGRVAKLERAAAFRGKIGYWTGPTLNAVILGLVALCAFFTFLVKWPG